MPLTPQQFDTMFGELFDGVLLSPDALTVFVRRMEAMVEVPSSRADLANLAEYLLRDRGQWISRWAAAERDLSVVRNEPSKRVLTVRHRSGSPQ